MKFIEGIIHIPKGKGAGQEKWPTFVAGMAFSQATFYWPKCVYFETLAKIKRLDAGDRVRYATRDCGEQTLNIKVQPLSQLLHQDVTWPIDFVHVVFSFINLSGALLHLTISTRKYLPLALMQPDQLSGIL